RDIRNPHRGALAAALRPRDPAREGLTRCAACGGADGRDRTFADEGRPCRHDRGGHNDPRRLAPAVACRRADWRRVGRAAAAPPELKSAAAYAAAFISAARAPSMIAATPMPPAVQI